MPIAEWDAINIEAADNRALLKFYSALTGMPMTDPTGEFPEIGAEGCVPIIVSPVENYAPPTWPTQERGQQLHLDIRVDDIPAAVQAAIEIGAREAEPQPHPEWWRVMIDPAGHPFCLTSNGDATVSGGIGTVDAVTIDAGDSRALSEFYGTLLGVEPEHSEHGYSELAVPGKPKIFLQSVDDYQPPTWPTQERGQQMHLDFFVDALDEAVAAAVEAGATVAPHQPPPPHDYYRIMIDPAGHPFCLALRPEDHA